MIHYASLVLASLLGSAAAGVAPSDGNIERRETQSSTDGTLHCGIFASGAKSTISGLQNDLAQGKLKGKYWTIGPGECNRVHCDDTSGIYVCNVCIFRGLFFPSNLERPPPLLFSPFSLLPTSIALPPCGLESRERVPIRLTTCVLGAGRHR